MQSRVTRLIRFCTAFTDNLPLLLKTAFPPPVVNERVRHFLNCTYEAYRREHYETCVESPSDVYKGPPPDDDDTGSILYEQTVLFAYLEDA